MNFRIWTTLVLVTIAQVAWGQTSTNPKLVNAEATSPEPSVNSYTVLGSHVRTRDFGASSDSDHATRRLSSASSLCAALEVR